MEQSAATITGRQCPFCHESVNKDAIKCSHCGKFLNRAPAVGHGKDKASEPNIAAAVVSNLFFPGIGSWKLGCKVRGAMIMVAMILCIVMASASYCSIVNSQMDAAMNMNDDAAFDASFSQSGTSWWTVFSGLLFVYSFVDIFLIYIINKKKKY